MLSRPSPPTKTRSSRKAAASASRRGQETQVAEHLLAVARQGDAAGLALALQAFFFDHVDSLAIITASAMAKKPLAMGGKEPSALGKEPLPAGEPCPVVDAFVAQLSAADDQPNVAEGQPPPQLGQLCHTGPSGPWQVALAVEGHAHILLSWQDSYSGQKVHRLATPIMQVIEAVQLRLKDLAKLQRLGHLAFIDPLTGLANSRQLKRFVTDQINRANRFGGGFTLLFVDLDKFKAINDTFGHDEGDRVLVEVAASLQSAVRSVDQVFRLGGDEFVIVLAGASAGTSAAVIDRIEAAFQKMPHQPSCSVGIASYPTDGYTFNELLKVADRGMYRSKNGCG